MNKLLIPALCISLAISTFAFAEDKPSLELQKLYNDRQTSNNQAFKIVGKMEYNNQVLIDAGKSVGELDRQLKAIQAQLKSIDAQIKKLTTPVPEVKKDEKKK